MECEIYAENSFPIMRDLNFRDILFNDTSKVRSISVRVGIIEYIVKYDELKMAKKIFENTPFAYTLTMTCIKYIKKISDEMLNIVNLRLKHCGFCHNELKYIAETCEPSDMAKIAKLGVRSDYYMDILVKMGRDDLVPN